MTRQFTFGIFNIEVPSYVFWILALIGLFWASYRVYRNLSIDYLELQKSSGVLLEVKPELSITLLEGNEYKYSLSKRATSREKVGYDYLTPDASIELHFRIKFVQSLGKLFLGNINSSFSFAFDFENPEFLFP